MNYSAEASFRRDPSAVINALLMDRTLRCVVVEGPTDRLFLKWIAGDELTCMIDEIANIDIKVPSGGNRERAISLAEFVRERLVENEEALRRIRVFIDADFAHIDDEVAILPLMLTDGRSMESYFLRLSCFRKIIELFMMEEEVDAESMFEATVNCCVELAAVREVDRQRSLQLPFSARKFKSFVKVGSDATPCLLLRHMVDNLLLASGRKVSMTPGIVERVGRVVEELRSYDPKYVVHGHDFERILGEILQSRKFPRSHVQKVLRMTFERRHVDKFPVLADLVAFLRAA